MADKFDAHPTRSTLTVLFECWKAAEREVVARWRWSSTNADEPFITEQLYGCLNEKLSMATQDGRVERAFAEDFYRQYPNLGHFIANDASHGLFMECRLHNRVEEGKTGGDFGLVISRPAVEFMDLRQTEQGLLCQAKRRQAYGSWGGLSNNQARVLPERVEYLAFILYDLLPGIATGPNPFQWLPCKGHSITEVETWLLTDKFPSTTDSIRTLKSLATGEIGTDDRRTIEQVIRLKARPELSIKIDWPDGQRPQGVHAINAPTQQDVVRLYN